MDENKDIRKNFGTTWPVHLSAFTALLTQLRGRFDGDLDLMLILAVIGSRIKPGAWKPELFSAQEMTSPEGQDDRQYPINIQSVAAYSGIPRETVRRKVRILQSKGWVTRDPEGRLAVSPSAAKDLADETELTLSYLAAVRASFDGE